MPSIYYGLAHPNPHGIQNPDGRYHGYMKRKLPIRFVVMHTPEALEDYVGDDTTAEGVSKYFTTTERSASASANIDSDSIIEFLPEDHVTFHCRNYNTEGYGVECGWKASSWGKNPAKDQAVIRNVARFLAPRVKRWNVPPRFLVKSQIDAGMRGFTSHGQLDPTRRSDPGTNFPWNDLFNLIIAEQIMSLSLEEENFVKQLYRAITNPGPTTGRKGDATSLMHVLEVVRSAGDASGISATDHAKLGAKLVE